MQNKTIILILLFAFLVIQNLRSQCVMIKAIAYLTPINLGYDFGIEAKLSNQWSGQLSYTIARKFEGDDTDMKYLHAFQIRRYFTDDFQKAFYLGGVLQKYFLKGEYYYTSQYIKVQKEDKKWGLGIIAGKHFRFSKRLGMDLHGGCMGQRGEIQSTTFDKANLPNDIKIDNVKFKLRRFWGLNLYIALGKTTTNKEKE